MYHVGQGLDPVLLEASRNTILLESRHEDMELYISHLPVAPGSSPPSSSSSSLLSSWAELLHRTHELGLHPRQSTLILFY